MKSTLQDVFEFKTPCRFFLHLQLQYVKEISWILFKQFAL